MFLAVLFFIPTLVFANTLTIKFEEISNLNRHLDCLSDYENHCDKPNYLPAWKGFLNPKRQKLLEEWKQLKEKNTVNFNQRRENRLSHTPLTRSEVSVDKKIKIIAGLSQDLNDYYLRMVSLVSSEDAIKFKNIMGEFFPNFHLWWSKNSSKGHTYLDRLNQVISRKDIIKQVNEIRFFYGAEISEDEPQYLFLYLVPENISKHSNSENFENFSTHEFFPKDKPVDDLPVIYHEIFHYYLKRVSKENQKLITEYFFNSPSAVAIPAYSYLNEIFATAWGNGYINRTLLSTPEFNQLINRPKGLYSQEFIDRGAKRLIPHLEQFLAKKKKLFNKDFLSEYEKMFEAEFAKDLKRIDLYTSEVALIVDKDVFEKSSFRKLFRPNSVTYSSLEGQDAFKDLEEYSKLNGFVILHPTKIEMIQNHIQPSTFELIKEKKKGFFVENRSPSSYLFIFVGESEDEIKNLITEIKSEGIN